MSHKGIRSLIEDVCKSLGNDIQFTYARTSDFNILRDKRYPFISLDLLSSTPIYAVDGIRNYMNRWACGMAFYELDNAASDQEQYALLLDSSDELVDKFVNKLNFYAYGHCIDSDMITISGITKTPFIKATADILTGFLLSFTIQVNDQFNYCGLDC